MQSTEHTLFVHIVQLLTLAFIFSNARAKGKTEVIINSFLKINYFLILLNLLPFLNPVIQYLSCFSAPLIVVGKFLQPVNLFNI